MLEVIRENYLFHTELHPVTATNDNIISMVTQLSTGCPCSQQEKKIKNN